MLNFKKIQAFVYGSCLFSLIRSAEGFESASSGLSTYKKWDFSVCGKSRKDASEIVNNKGVASLGDWPWIVALGYYDSITFEFKVICAGTLISKSWLITAAHCPSDEISIARLGEIDINDAVDDGAGPIDIPIEQMVQHPNFSSITNINDIALVRLNIAIKFTRWIRPLCLLSGIQYNIDAFYLNKTLVTIGWGHTESGLQTTSLTQILITPTPLPRCIAKYSESLNTVLNENVICEEKTDKKNSCGGNSGGSLMVAINNTFHLAGVVSSRDLCSNGNSPAIYTKVSQYVEWIKETTKIIGSSCTTVDKQPGTCTNYLDCPPFLEFIKHYGSRRAAVSAAISKYLCQNDMNEIIICCSNTAFTVREETSNTSPEAPYFITRSPPYFISSTNATETISQSKALYITTLAANYAKDVFDEYTTKVPVQKIAPRWIVQPTNESFLQHDNVIIQCSAEGVPRPRITWKGITGDISGDSDINVEDDGSLKFKHILSKNRGYYVCKADNGVGPGLAAVVYIDVKVPPYWTSKPVDQTFIEGNKAVIECGANGIPNPQITWKKSLTSSSTEYVELKNNNHIQIDNGTLTIKHIQSSNEGHYLCEIVNGVDPNLFEIIKVTVQVPLRWVSKPIDAVFSEGSDAEIRCKADGNPHPQIVWKRIPDNVLDNTGKSNERFKTKDGTLMIKSIGKNDEGRYECEATNGIGPNLATVISISVQGGNCTHCTTNDKRPGVCMNYVTCPFFNELVTSQGSRRLAISAVIDKYLCYNDGDQPVMCCPNVGCPAEGKVNLQSQLKAEKSKPAVSNTSTLRVTTPTLPGSNCTSCSISDKVSGSCMDYAKCPFYEELVKLRGSKKKAAAEVKSNYSCHDQLHQRLICCPNTNCGAIAVTTSRPPEITQRLEKSNKRAKESMSLRSVRSSFDFDWKEFGTCAKDKLGTNEYQLNVHLQENQEGLKEIVGNLTLLVPFDDTFTLRIHFHVSALNMFSFPSTFQIPIAKGCSGLNMFVQEGWRDFLRSMNASVRCPIPAGVYFQKGYLAENFLRSDYVPEVLLSGTYKITVEYLKNKIVAGCSQIVFEAIPKRLASSTRFGFR